MSYLKFLRASFALGVVVITLLCIVPMNSVRLRHLSEYAVHVMFGWLLLSMFFMVLRRERMMWTTLAAAAVLAVFLRERSNLQLTPTVALEDRPTVSVGLFNTVNSDELRAEMVAEMRLQRNDLLAIQEVDPFWRQLLLDSLTEQYPYHLEVQDLGSYGMLVFSPHPLTPVDSFRVDRSPVLVGELSIPDTPLPLRFVTTYIPPLLNNRVLAQQQHVLDTLGDYCDRIRQPLLTLGAFNAVTWSSEMGDFLKRSMLRNSRRGLGQFTQDDRIDLFDIQRDHILFSQHLTRISFRAVDWSSSERHGGFVGTYQFANTVDDVAPPDAEL